MKLFNKLVDPSKVWVTSDWHLNHKNICANISTWDSKDGCRDFQSLEEMNDTIINAINRNVKEDDILINLGDIIFGDKKKLPEMLERINCKNHHYIFGNHDDWMIDRPEVLSLFTSVHHYLQFFLKFPNGEKIRVCCSHYPITSWNDMNKNSWMIHGHCHQSLHHDNGKIIDVGIDEIHNYKPYLALEIYQFMKNRDVRKVDHH